MKSHPKTESIPTNRAGDDALPLALRGLAHSYHSQALKQATVLFWFSLIAATLGLTLIAYTVITSLNITSASQPALKLGLSAITELVAGLLFRESATARQRATNFYDRLRLDLKETNAVDLINSIENSSIRDLIKVRLASQMAGCSRPPLTQDR
jgi:hypothetical protein